MTPEIKKRIEQIRRGEVPEGYKKTKVGIVPFEWRETKFEKMFSRVTRKNKENNDNVLTISAQYGLISQRDFFNKDIASEDKTNYFLLKKGEFAYNKSYSNGYPFGALKRLEMYDLGIVSPLYICFSATEENSCPDFYVQYFEAGKMDREIQAFAQEGARNHGLLNISVDDFFNSYLIMPSIAEQKRIAEILSVQDKIIALKEKLLEEKKRQKKALMQQLLTGKKRLLGFVGEWKEMKLGDICSTYSGGTPNRANSEFYGGDIPWIKSGELNQGDIYYTEESLTRVGLENSSAKIVPSGTLLIAMYGATAGALAFTHIDAAINQAILALIPSMKVNTLLLKESLMIQIEIATHRLTQGGQPNFNASIIKSFKIILPSIDEQDAIANIAKIANDEISLLQKEIDQEKQKKKALMQLLLTGIVRVN